MKTLVILFLAYLLFRFLLFFFRAFMVLLKQRKLWKQMMQHMQHQQRPQRRDGDVVIEYASEEQKREKEKPKSQQGGEYVDYEIIK